MRRPTIRFATVGACLVLGACASEKPAFDAPNPSRRLDAIVRAAGPDAEPGSLRRLVEQLDSPDPAARMLAIRALEERTGLTMGYNHTDPVWKRQESVERWMNYLDSGAEGSDLPSTAGARP